MPNLYVISGCNGAGKTTASYSVLPEMLSCEEFINADEIARGLSPFNPEKAAIEAGRIMLNKIVELIKRKRDFAFETTLSSKSYVRTIENAKKEGFKITLIFFWLDSVDLAIERVETRVREGGHNIPQDVIRRRYYAGLRNLFDLYISNADYWLLFNTSKPSYELIAEGNEDKNLRIENNRIFELMKKQRND